MASPRAQQPPYARRSAVLLAALLAATVPAPAQAGLLAPHRELLMQEVLELSERFGDALYLTGAALRGEPVIMLFAGLVIASVAVVSSTGPRCILEGYAATRWRVASSCVPLGIVIAVSFPFILALPLFIVGLWCLLWLQQSIHNLCYWLGCDSDIDDEGRFHALLELPILSILAAWYAQPEQAAQALQYRATYKLYLRVVEDVPKVVLAVCDWRYFGASYFAIAQIAVAILAIAWHFTTWLARSWSSRSCLAVLVGCLTCPLAFSKAVKETVVETVRVAPAAAPDQA